MSKLIKRIGEHVIELPPLPKDKHEILFVDEKPQNAYWRRIDFPKIWYDFNPKTKIYQQDTVYDQDDIMISLSYEDSETLKRLLIQENKRRTKGVYMKNGEDFEWLAPSYYYNLQWMQMKDLPKKYGDFREPQNDVLSLWHYVKFKWEWCHGLVIPKCKKSGITQILAGDYCNEGTSQKGWEMGMMSKEYDHATDVGMAYFFHGFDNLPFIMQPDVRKRNEHEIIFGTPTARIGSKAASNTKGKKSVLNSHVFASKTKPTGFDGPVMRLVWISEMPKMWEASKVSPDTVHKKVVETAKLQTKKNGAIVYESYMPEIDDRGFREFREICKQSELSTINPVTGKTQSSLIMLPLTGVESSEECFDIHGRCDRRRALFLINAENDSKKTTSDKLAHRRQYPRDKNDMFDSGGRGAVFDNPRIAVHQREVELECKSGKRPWREGHVRWRNSLWETGLPENKRPSKEFALVDFEEFTEEELAKGVEGSVKFYHDLPKEYFNQVIQMAHKDEDGEFLAPIDGDEIIVGGCDPTDYAYKSDITEGSLVAAHGGFLYNPAMDTKFKKTISNTVFFEYHFRHENPDDDLEMIIKLILYLNMRIIVEANKKWLITALKREGLQNFLLLKQSDGSIRPYKKGDENRLVSTTHGIIDAYIRSIKRWHNKDSVPDYLRTYKSLKGLQELMDFDQTDTKKFNLVVSLGYYRLANDAYSVFKMDNEQNKIGEGMEQAFIELIDF